MVLPRVTYPKFRVQYSQLMNFDFDLALLNEKLVALHEPVMCKDYFQDAFWCEYNDKEQEVYGFKWKPGTLSTELPTYMLAVRWKDRNMRARRDRMQEFLNMFDAAQSFMPTAVIETHDDDVVIAQFDRQWMALGPPMLSAFTSLLRLSPAYPGGSPVEWFKQLGQLYKPHVGWNTDVIPASQKKQHGFSPLWAKPELDPPFIWPEVQRLGSETLTPKLMALLAGRKCELSWTKLPTASTAHSSGVINHNGFPKEKV